MVLLSPTTVRVARDVAVIGCGRRTTLSSAVSAVQLLEMLAASTVSDAAGRTPHPVLLMILPKARAIPIPPTPSLGGIERGSWLAAQILDSSYRGSLVLRPPSVSILWMNR
jgi:hypothetical protein